ncbi:MAG: PPK2 family polyphosphate kinase [Dehalococcoidia bacterium]
MFTAPQHPTLAPFDGSFDLAACPTEIEDRPDEDDLEDRLVTLAERIDDLQRRVYADDRWAVLLIFQGRDAAGKDGTIRAVFNRSDPAGVHVKSFQTPSHGELQHDFLWRSMQHLPERGHIGVFNRSYYEEVLIARVHPALLEAQRLPEAPAPGEPVPPEFWDRRFQSIRDHELHLARNGTAIVKFFLNVSYDEQRQRFLDRLEDPAKHWKFRESDIRDREYWDEYTAAYQSAIGATSRAWAPWYVIPADDKEHLRVLVAERIIEAIESLDLRPPEPSFERPVEELRAVLEADRRA